MEALICSHWDMVYTSLQVLMSVGIHLADTATKFSAFRIVTFWNGRSIRRVIFSLTRALFSPSFITAESVTLFMKNDTREVDPYIVGLIGEFHHQKGGED